MKEENNKLQQPVKICPKLKLMKHSTRVAATFDSFWFKVGASHLNGVLLHGQRPVDSVQFEVKAARIAHRFTLVVTSPQRRGGRAAVGTSQTRTPRRRLSKRN